MRTPFTGINHLALVTGDMPATIRFWRDLLGCPLTVAMGHAGYRHYFFALSDNDQIAFFEWPGITPMVEKDHGQPVAGAVGFDHFSLQVASIDELFGLKDRLEAAGFWASEIVDHGFIRSLYSFDPNNIPIEFSAPTPGVDIRKTPLFSDLDPLPEVREGSSPVPGRWPAPKRPTPREDWRVYPGDGRDALNRLLGHEQGED